jgi:hypothetical protein
MKIEQFVPPFVPHAQRKKEPKGSFKVSSAADTSSEEIFHTLETQEMGAPSALTSLQEATLQGIGAKEKLHHGFEMIGGLQNFQLSLLQENHNKESLESLRQELLRINIQEDDPLSQIVKEIRQRVAIEIAKHQENS